MPSNVDGPEDESEGTVLAPEELDISDDQNVVELEDGRYLISAEGADAQVVETTSDPLDAADAAERERTAGGRDDAHRVLADRMRATDSRYGFDITAVFEGTVAHQELFSNDVIATFENLLIWYAQHVGGDTPVEDVLGILMAESTTSARFPTKAVDTIMAAYELEPEDTLADLREAVRQDGGLRFPADSDA